MRRQVLWSSVRRVLDTDEELLDIAYMWHRHRLMLPYAIAAGVLCGIGGVLVGFGVASAAAIGVAAAAIAASAVTEYRVLAITELGLVLMKGGRIRQVATGLIERLPDTTTVEREASNMIISEWRVGESRYSVLRRFESTMAAIAAAYPP